MKALTLLFLSFLAAASLSGCVTLPDPEASQESSADAVGSVGNGQTVGQTFVARRPRLAGVELWLSLPEGSGSRELVVELLEGPTATVPLVSRQVDLSAQPALRPLRVLFGPQAGPPGQSYYLRLTSSGTPVEVLGRAEDVYPQGQAFLDDVPLEADIAFRLFYEYGAAAILGDLGRLLPRLWLALPLAALLLLPGWLLLDLLGLNERFDPGERIALAVGLSVALVPLLLLWTTVAGLRWNREAVLVGVGALAVVAAQRWFRRTRQQGDRTPGRGPTAWLLFILWGVALLVRLAIVRDLVVPAWVDSVHHALIARLIAEQGALPQSYAPFINIDTASYHPGFHSLVATFHWLSGLDVARAMLLLGQVLNALMVPAAYLLTKELTRDRRAGLAAALVVGLFSPMPAYYVNWGRYTQLAGLLVLPATLTLTRWALSHEARERPNRFLAPAALALGGLILVHNQVAAFSLCLLLAYLLVQRAREWVGKDRGGQRLLLRDGLRLVLLGGGALLPGVPWLVPAMTTLWLPLAQEWSGQRVAEAFAPFSWRHLTGGMGKYTLALAMLGLGWALLRCRRFAWTVLLWVVFLLGLVGLGVWGLPGGGFVNPLSVEIMLFLPVSVLAGYVAAELLAAWRAALAPRRCGLYRGAGLALGGGLLALGIWTMLPILNPNTVLFHRPDEAAIHWIAENTPPDARFLVNPMPWSAYLYAGYDGGYWIGPLAARQTFPMPVLYGLASTDEIQAINSLCRTVTKVADDPQALWSVLTEWEITHIYIGARRGVLSARALAGSDLYETMYKREGVWIFRLKPDTR